MIALFLAALAVGGFAQEDELGRLSAELSELRRQASDPDLATGAVIALTGIVDRPPGEANPESPLAALEAEIAGRALEYRARAHVSRGDRDDAANDFRTLLLLRPGWELDRADLSPAVVDAFEQERVRLVAWIHVESTPPGAEVLVGGAVAGETPLVAWPVIGGSIRVRLERAGYADFEFPRMDLLAGEVVRLEHELERSGPVLPIATAPAGVTVRVDGRVAGTTGGDLPERLAAMVPPRFAGEEFSAPLRLGGLRIGAHEITLSAPCRRQSRFTFHADEARDYLPRFVRLRPSTGALLVESVPSGARVLLDGEDRGVAPLTFSALCAGRHEVEIRHPAGRCRKSVDIARDARASVSCATRPLIRLVPGDPDANPAAEEAVRRALGASADWFVLPDGATDAAAAEVRVAAAGRVELLAPGSAVPDQVPFDRFDPASAGAAAEALLQPVARRRVWIGFSAGLRFARGEDHVPRPVLEVFSVHPDGPAALAGVEAGDRLAEIEGEPVADESHFRQSLLGRVSGDALDVLLARDGADRPLRIVLADAPVLPSPAGHRCNRRLVQLLAGRAAGVEDAAAGLEEGICRFLLDDPEAALSGGLALRESVGPLEGTRRYYRGLALLALGERSRAIESFEAAEAFPEAFLVSPDGPRLAPLLRRRLRNLR